MKTQRTGHSARSLEIDAPNIKHHLGWKGFTPVKIRESTTSFEMDVIMPGVSKERIVIKVRNCILSIRIIPGDEYKNIQHTLYPSALFFRLENNINIRKITACYDKGIIRLILPKSNRSERCESLFVVPIG